jgi:NADPH:quinone reductase-like Zn-dependent oxidoreductase
MSDDQIQIARELATHASDIRHMKDDIDSMINTMKDMNATLISINTTLSEAKGGWKMLMLVGGAGGAVGSFLTYIANALSHK